METVVLYTSGYWDCRVCYGPNKGLPVVESRVVGEVRCEWCGETYRVHSQLEQRGGYCSLSVEFDYYRHLAILKARALGVEIGESLSGAINQVWMWAYDHSRYSPHVYRDHVRQINVACGLRIPETIQGLVHL